jgi:hypothetical protein
VLEDKQLASQLSEAGLRRAAEFSMARLAEIYVELYQRAIEIDLKDPERGGWRRELSRLIGHLT